jgi:hypothetical protein
MSFNLTHQLLSVLFILSQTMDNGKRKFALSQIFAKALIFHILYCYCYKQSQLAGTYITRDQIDVIVTHLIQDANFVDEWYKVATRRLILAKTLAHNGIVTKMKKQL